MADIKINYLDNGAEKIKKDFETLQNGIKKINSSEVKLTMRDNDIKATIDAVGRLRTELPKLEKTYNSLQNKSSAVAKTMQRDIKLIETSFQELNSIIGKQGKVSSNVYDNLKNSGALSAQLSTEKQITDELERQAKARASQEKELDTLRTKLQTISRTIADQQNALSTGKRGKTPYDMANLLKQLEEGKIRAEELAAALGEDNEVVRHFRNGMNWTDNNNPLRAMRDEAYKLIPEMKSLEQEITKLKASGTDKNLLAFDEKRLTELQERFTTIKQTFEEAKNTLGDNPQYAAYIEQLKQSVDLFEQQYQKITQVATARQQAINSDKQEKSNYEQLKRQVQEIYSLEEKLAKLKKDKSGNRAEIEATQQLLAHKKVEYDVDRKISQLNGERKRELDAITKKHQESLQLIEAQKNKMSQLGDTIKKVFNYVAVYKGFSLLTQGIQQAIDTMKELDKAFTDIQMVTGGTDEETAQLAQEYNGLAKSLGATTKEVADGAGEWLRQGKTAEETTKLLTASMTFSKVGAIEASEATQLLTSSLNGYKLEAEDAMTVVDKISAIDLAAATSSEELATALARTANIANDSSVSFDKLLAMIGTVSSVTRRSASTIRRSI